MTVLWGLMRLKTSHGTYVVAGQDRELLHCRESPDWDLDSIWNGAPPPVPTSGATEVEVVVGPLAPSTLVALDDGLFAFRRDGLYLCADPRFPSLRFDREEVGGWERFALLTADGEQDVDEKTPGDSWLEVQFVPSYLRPNFARSIDAFLIQPSSTFHVKGHGDYIHAPITPTFDHLRLFQQGIKNYYPTQFGKFEEISFYINREQSKYLNTSDNTCGVVFDRSGFLTNSLFLNGSNVPEYIRINNGHYKVNFSHFENIHEEDVSVFVFYDGTYNNYYHWWAEALVNLEISDAYLGHIPPVIIWNGKPALKRWQLDSLELLGVEIIYRNSENPDIVLVKEVTWIEQNDICYVPGYIFRRLSQRVLKAIGAPLTKGVKIYLKRRASRTVENAVQLEELLGSWGYQPIYAEDFSQVEQIKMFSSAQAVIAVHGAGLTNMLFMPSGSSVIELMPSFEVRTFFWLMAEKMRHKYGVLVCRSASGDYNSSIEVDLSDLGRLLAVMDAHGGFSGELGAD